MAPRKLTKKINNEQFEGGGKKGRASRKEKKIAQYKAAKKEAKKAAKETEAKEKAEKQKAEKLNKEKLEALTLQIKSNQASNISTNLVSLKEKNKNIPEKKGSKLSSSQKQNTLLIYGLIASLVFVTALLIFSYLKSSKNTTTTKELSKENESLGQKNKSLVQKTFN